MSDREIPLHILQPHFKMAEHLIGLIQDLQSDCEIYDSAFLSIKENHKKSPSSRVNQALDALADVLVSDKSDVFAIAARMTRDKLILTIATNTSAKLKAIDHPNCIWKHLNAIGNEYAGLQQQQKCPLALDDDAMTTTFHDIFEAKRMIAISSDTCTNSRRYKNNMSYGIVDPVPKGSFTRCFLTTMYVAGCQSRSLSGIFQQMIEGVIQTNK